MQYPRLVIVLLAVSAILFCAQRLIKKPEPALTKASYLCATPLGLAPFEEGNDAHISEKAGYLVYETPAQTVTVSLQNCIKVESRE